MSETINNTMHDLHIDTNDSAGIPAYLNTMLAAYTFFSGFLGTHFELIVPNTDVSLDHYHLILSIVLQLTSLLTFCIFMIINFPKAVKVIADAWHKSSIHHKRK